jgi:hypothetical protein
MSLLDRQCHERDSEHHIDILPAIADEHPECDPEHRKSPQSSSRVSCDTGHNPRADTLATRESYRQTVTVRKPCL